MFFRYTLFNLLYSSQQLLLREFPSIKKYLLKGIGLFISRVPLETGKHVNSEWGHPPALPWETLPCDESSSQILEPPWENRFTATN
jgi:hypothetical protein